jgi:hypothetical protein
LFNLPAGTTPWDIVTGPDGNLWYTGQKHDVGRITTAGASKNFPSAGLDPFGITAGPDGALWYAQNGENNIGRMTTAGTASQIGGLTAIPDGASPRYITPGPGNTLWFTEDFGNRIGRITGIDIPGGGGGGGTTTDTTRPGVSALGMTDTTVVVGPGATPLTGTAAATTGTTIRYTLSEAATVRLRFERKLAGRRVKKGKKRICAKPTRKNRKKRKCTRYKLAGTLTRSSKQGKNSVKFSGRIGKKALKRGSYRLVVTATDAAGNKSKAKSLSFRVVKPAKRKRR